MLSFTKSAVLVSGIILLAACSSAPKSSQLASDNGSASSKSKADAKAAASDPRAVATVDATASAGAHDAMGAPDKKSVYFDYDSFSVQGEYAPVVSANANYLAKAHGKKIIIQGNADERGGSEYNLALGQKRAEAVRKTLAYDGIPNSQMEAVSFGKEKPKAIEHNEQAWAENRRADIVYSAN